MCNKVCIRGYAPLERGDTRHVHRVKRIKYHSIRCVEIDTNHGRTGEPAVLFYCPDMGGKEHVMQNVIDKIELAFAAFGGFLGWFWGGFDGFLYALIVFVVLDYFTGLLAAGVRRELSSEIGFKGIAKKACIFILVGLANIVDTQVIGNGSAIRTAVIFFYLSNEGLSILENSAIIGLPVPEKLKDMLLQLTEEEHHNRESGENKADDNRNSTNSN